MILIELMMMTMMVMTWQKQTKAVADYVQHLQIQDQHSQPPIRSTGPNAHQVPNDQSYHHPIKAQYSPTLPSQMTQTS